MNSLDEVGTGGTGEEGGWYCKPIKNLHWRCKHENRARGAFIFNALAWKKRFSGNDNYFFMVSDSSHIGKEIRR